MNQFSKCLVLALLLCAGAAFSAGGEAPGDVKRYKPSRDPVIYIARLAMAEGDWVGVQGYLKDALQDHPNNADYHNLYAYAMRKGPNPDMDEVLAEYAEALRIDPNHRQAHEYIGEAYLQINNLAKAKEHLAALDKICFFGCEEYYDLKSAIAKYEKSQSAPTDSR